jgi:hypothetical protein
MPHLPMLALAGLLATAAVETLCPRLAAAQDPDAVRDPAAYVSQ